MSREFRCFNVDIVGNSELGCGEERRASGGRGGGRGGRAGYFRRGVEEERERAGCGWKLCCRSRGLGRRRVVMVEGRGFEK